MKKDCAVVQDLLVLYEDDVLKDESKEMVEEHLRGCEKCMQVYEESGRELPVIEKVPEASEEEQEEAAVWAMKKLTKRITYKTVLIFASIVAILCIAWAVTDSLGYQLVDGYGGIVEMIYTIPTENIRVTEMYQLKNGDIYCTIESDKEVGVEQIADWIIPEGKGGESTDEASKEIRFREAAFWESNVFRRKRISIIFNLERQGTAQGSDKRITQSCAEIRVCGKTNEDALVIWKRGQKLEEASESMEKEAIRLYAQEGLLTKAIKECDNMGWDNYEELFGDAGLSWRGEGGGGEEWGVFSSEEDSFFLN